MGEKITAIGSYRPCYETRKNFEQKVEIDSNLLAQFPLYIMGDENRHRQKAKESIISMAEKAVDNCLEKSRLGIEQIDLIIHVSDYQDHLLGDVTKIQKAIGADHARSYQIKNVGSVGALVAFLHAASLIKTDMYRNILVICIANIVSKADHMTKFCDTFTTDLATAILFAHSSDNCGLIGSHSITLADQQKNSQWLPIEYGTKLWSSALNDCTNGDIPALHNIIKRQGKEVINKALAKAGLTLEEIHWFVPLNVREEILESWLELSGIEQKCCLHTFNEIGNCSMSSIPFTIMKAVEQNKFSPGDKLVFLAIGQGLHLIALVWQW